MLKKQEGQGDEKKAKSEVRRYWNEKRRRNIHRHRLTEQKEVVKQPKAER